MKRAIILAAVVALMTACSNQPQTTEATETKKEEMKQELNLTQEWDKVFPLSEKVNHRKVTFETQYGLTLAADLYTPKDAEGKLAAIAVRLHTNTWLKARQKATTSSANPIPTLITSNCSSFQVPPTATFTTVARAITFRGIS